MDWGRTGGRREGGGGDVRGMVEGVEFREWRRGHGRGRGIEGSGWLRQEVPPACAGRGLGLRACTEARRGSRGTRVQAEMRGDTRPHRRECEGRMVCTLRDAHRRWGSGRRARQEYAAGGSGGEAGGGAGGARQGAGRLGDRSRAESGGEEGCCGGGEREGERSGRASRMRRQAKWRGGREWGQAFKDGSVGSDDQVEDGGGAGPRRSMMAGSEERG